jgi:hypothetical protein
MLSDVMMYLISVILIKFILCIYIVTCRPNARVRVEKHVSIEIDAWKPVRRFVINKRFLGYGYAI